MEISLCMIVRNEEACLRRCLESVRGAVDEIVILDTGSTDRTKEIAREFTPCVYDDVWNDDFAAARNAAFSHATKPYLMWMDADDVLDAPEREKLIALKPALDGSIDAVMLPYVCGLRPDGEPLLVFDRERIVRAGAGFRFEGAVHEAMQVSGKVIREDIAIRHTGMHGKGSNARNLAIYERWMSSERPMGVRDWYYYARELADAHRFSEAERVFARVTAKPCWSEIRIGAHVQRAKCLLAMGRIDEARAELLSALAVDTPRADALCMLGLCEMQAGRDAAAALWYRAARVCERAPGSAFVCADDYDYVPSIQLCVLLDRMGRTREAAQENERALIARPGDPAATANREYFSKKLAADKMIDVESVFCASLEA